MKRLFYVTIGFFITCLLPQLAFAQSFNILNPPAIANQTDLSVQYLQDIFGVVDGVLHGSGSQIMGHMFMVFNAGALVLGGIIIMYTLLVSTLQTAHEGEPLGRKWSSLWIPIRSAAGIALLLPKATGYSVIQIFLMWAVVQGIAVADSVWDNALLYLAQGGMLVQQELAPSQNQTTAAGNLLRSETCMYAVQGILNQSYQDAVKAGQKNIPVVPYFMSTVTPIKNNPLPTCQGQNGACIDFPGKASNYGYDPSYDYLQGICGNLTWNNNVNWKIPGLAQITIQQFLATQVIAIQQMILDLSGPAQAAVQAQLTLNPDQQPIDVSTVLQPTLLGNTSEDYQGIIEPALAAIIGGGGANPVSQAIFKQAADEGWIEAGTFYPILAQTNDNLERMHGGNLTASANSDALQKSLGTNGVNLLKLSWLNPAYAQKTVNIFLPNQSLDQYIKKATDLSHYNINGGWQTGGGNQTVNVIEQIGGRSGTVLSLVFGPLVGPLIGIMTSFAALATSQFSNFNPVVAIGLLGGSLISLVAQVWIYGAVSAGVLTGALGAIPCVTESNIVSSVFLWLVPLLWAVLGALFVNGCIMAFYIPMIPFILFTFGAIGWFMSVIEAMAAGPIIALGITHPEGAEVLGKADPAVLLLVNIFLRPSLMIIGFIAGIILSYVAIWFLNQGFFEAFGFIAITNFSTAAAFLLGLPALLIIYVILIIGILNEAFSLINDLADKVMRWLGQQGEQLGHKAKEALGAAQSGIRGAAGETASALGDASRKAGEARDQRTAELSNESKSQEGGGSTELQVGKRD